MIYVPRRADAQSQHFVRSTESDRSRDLTSRGAESDAALDELIRKYGRTTPYNVAYTLAFRGEIDRAFEWLEKAVEYGDLYLSTLGFDAMMDILHDDPRWLPLLRRLGQAPE